MFTNTVTSILINTLFVITVLTSCTNQNNIGNDYKNITEKSQTSNLSNDAISEAAYEYIELRLQEIENSIENEEHAIDVAILDVKNSDMGINIEYTITANKDVYIIDYNQIDCTNELRERLVDNNTLYYVFHAGINLFCEPFTLYFATPPWPLMLLEEGETAHFSVHLSKEPLDDGIYAKQMGDIETVRFIFGYITKENLAKTSQYILEQSDDYVKIQQIQMGLQGYELSGVEVSF